MTLNNETAIQLNLIFACLLIHLVCLPRARSGLYMMKYVVCHPEEFVQPQFAFLLGFTEFSTLWFAEIINMMKATTQTKPLNLVVGAIGLKLIIDFPTMYYGTLSSPIKSKVGKLKVKRARKAVRDDDEKMPFHWFYNFVYVLNKWFFNSIYFYFFSFIVVFVPFTKFLVETAEE